MSLHCCRADGRYTCGDKFECSWRIERLNVESLQGLELSVLWYTEGKGDEDISVHFFRRLSAARLREMDLKAPHQFVSLLPESPTSYDGHLLRIRWCARMRLFLTGGQEVVSELPFTMHAAEEHAAEDA